MPRTYQQQWLVRFGEHAKSFLRMYKANYRNDQRRFKEQADQSIKELTNELEKRSKLKGLERVIPMWMRVYGAYEHGNYPEGLEYLTEFVASYMELPMVREAFEKQ